MTGAGCRLLGLSINRKADHHIGLCADACSRSSNPDYFNADEICAQINKGVGFLSDLVVRAGHNAVAHYVCPTPETRAAFGARFVICVDRIEAGRFAVRVTPGPSAPEWATQIIDQMKTLPQSAPGSYA